MSVRRVQVRWLSLRPRVWIENDRLLATTCRPFRVLSLFSYGRMVDVNRATRRITITTRTWWLFVSRRVVPFESVRHLEYRYGGMGQWEFFVVEMILRHPEPPVALFTFMGEGSQETAIPLMPTLDGLVDFHGDQEQASLGYVELLCRFIGTRVGPAFGRQPPPRQSNGD